MALIVGIGASAGGLDAFTAFFAAMPPDSGVAFVLVQHLSPDHKSLLAELLAKTTAMPVMEAADGVMVLPDSVFVIPPDATMTIAAGRLSVARPASPSDRRRPIDLFFQSLAADQGENAVGIVLAGTGSDGTQGLSMVKEQGGLTLAQAEFDAQALPGMPRNAVATGDVDAVLDVGRGDAGPDPGLSPAPDRRRRPQGRRRHPDRRRTLSRHRPRRLAGPLRA